MISDKEEIQYRSVSIPALVGGGLGLLSIFSLLSPFFWIFGIGAMILSTWAIIVIRRYPDLFTGERFAWIGLCVALLCVMASVTDFITYNLLDRASAKKFADQWFLMALNGQIKEACQLELPHRHRASGAGIEMRLIHDTEQKKTYESFIKSPGGIALMKCQGGTAKYEKMLGLFMPPNRWSYSFLYDVTDGNENTLPFIISVETSYLNSMNQYEWRWLGTSLRNPDLK